MYCLIVVDLQERLLKRITNSDEIIKNTSKLLKAFKVFRYPVLATEQIKLGETVEGVRELLDEVIVKSTFSCLKCKEFYKRFKEICPKKVVLTGVEAHICVLQTALDLIREGCEVHVAVDCIGSRREVDRETAVMRMMQEGVKLTTAETVIYEIMESADHERFKEILEIVKG